MTSFAIRVFRADDEAAIVALWHQCNLVVPWNNPRRDIERKCRTDPDGFIVGEVANQTGSEPVASLMFGYDGHRGWLNYLAVRPDCRGQGYGRALVAYAENQLRDRGCPKINLQIRASNQQIIDFYTQLGFSTDPVLSLGKRLEKD